MRIEVTIPGEPRPKARPRVVRGGRQVYSPSAEEEDRVAWHIAAACAVARVNTIYGRSYGVEATFFLGDRRRVDGDNLLKLVLDAGTRARIWPDDSLVTEGSWRIVRGDPNPRTELVIEAL